MYSIVGSSWRLKDSVGVLALSRIMLQAETPSQRIMLLQVAIQSTTMCSNYLSPYTDVYIHVYVQCSSTYNVHAHNTFTKTQ